MYQNVLSPFTIAICLHVSLLNTCLDGLDASKSGRPAVAEARIRLQQPLLPFNCNKNHEKSLKSKLQWEFQTVFIQYPFQSLAALHCVLLNPTRTCFTLRSQAVTTDAHLHAWKTFEVETRDVYQIAPAFEVYKLQSLNLSPNFAVQVLVHFWRAWCFACKRCQRCKILSHAPCAAFTESSTTKTESWQTVAKHDITGKLILIIWYIVMYWRLEPLRYVQPINILVSSIEKEKIMSFRKTSSVPPPKSLPFFPSCTPSGSGASVSFFIRETSNIMKHLDQLVQLVHALLPLAVGLQDSKLT